MKTFYFRDNIGWPVERYERSPITNFIRLLIHTNIKKTWQLRNRGCASPWDIKDDNTVQQAGA